MKLKRIVNNVIIKKVIKFCFKFLTREQVIKIQYKIVLKRNPNLKNPRRFTEKIQWYKLHYRNPVMTQCVDKYQVREYILLKGLEDTLVDLYQVCDKFEDIDFELLPESFVIKSNKGSGTNIFVKNKSLMDYRVVKKEVESWGTVNTVLMGSEWAYENVPDKIVIEEILVDKNDKSQDIKDYKVLCFNGIAKYIWVDTDRSTNHKRNIYDLDWNLINVKSDVPNTSENIPRPNGLGEMIKMAELISKDFPFARIDFYWVNEKIYFGEITFYPWSGCVQFTPDEFDFELGQYFSLPMVDK